MYETEIIELHVFFEDWFNGRLPDTDAAFARFADTMDAHFRIVSPSGVMTQRDVLLQTLRQMHNQHIGTEIWIKNVQLAQKYDSIHIVMYEEWQKSPDKSARGRLSTAVFLTDATQPNGLRWLHVHETWLPKR